MTVLLPLWPRLMSFGWALLAASAAAAPPASSAQPASAPHPTQQLNAQPTQVVVSGTVPDEATRALILSRARSIYGAERVIDQLGVGPVTAPSNWLGHVEKMLTPELRNVSRGKLTITGNDVDLKGEVSSEARRVQIPAELLKGLNPTFVLRNGLRVVAAEQDLLDAALGNRPIEFEPSSSVLRASSTTVLDDVAAALLKLGSRRIEVIGHTDAVGSRDANMALSLARADSVRAHLLSKGVAALLISTSGAGPDAPVASNDTPEGRSRNRRIEFRLSQ